MRRTTCQTGGRKVWVQVPASLFPAATLVSYLKLPRLSESGCSVFLSATQGKQEHLLHTLLSGLNELIFVKCHLPHSRCYHGCIVTFVGIRHFCFHGYLPL